MPDAGPLPERPAAAEVSSLPGVSRRISALAAAMRAHSARPGVGSVLLAHRALAAVDPSSRDVAYLALRTVLCSSHADLERFDAAFAAVFDAPPAGVEAEAEAEAAPTAERDEAAPQEADPAERGTSEEGDAADGGRMVAPQASGAADPDAEDDLDAEEIPAAASAIAVLRRKDFADYTDEELVAARRIVSRLAAAAPMRRSGRLRRARDHGHGRVLDLRRTLRTAARHGATGVEPSWRERGERPRRVVLVCDVSGSMQPYARVLLSFLAGWVRSGRPVEAFVFGTHLTRITRDLGGGDMAAALERATERVTDWGSGTQIGASIAQLNREHGRRIGRSSIVIVVSDGWECGDPELLAAELARLRRSARALVWLNPHAADPAFEPLTRGMRAALPSTDELLAGNCIASLEELAGLLETDPRFSARGGRPAAPV